MPAENLWWSYLPFHLGNYALALLFWTLVGVTTIAVGVGPRTGPDILYHLAIVAVLVWGIVVARMARVTTT